MLFSEDIVKGDRYVIRWLPGGVVEAILNGAIKEPITNVTFARVLWRIWLGDDSIVDRDKLVKMVVDD